jgi:hypothetical protein
MNSICGPFRVAQKSDEKSDSIPDMDNRFRSDGFEKIKNDLCEFIPKSMGFRQSILRFQAGRDL